MDAAEDLDWEVSINGRTIQTQGPGNDDNIDQARGFLNPSPSYQSYPPPSEANQIVASETLHVSPVGTNPTIRTRPTSKWSWGRSMSCIISFLFIAIVASLFSAVAVSPDQVAHMDGERTMPPMPPKVFRRSDLLPSPTTFSAVFGLYIIPATTTRADWLRADHQQIEPEMATTTNFEDTVWGPSGIGETSPPANGKGRREYEVNAPEKEVSFDRWGVEILYRLHRRAIRAIHIQSGWCMDNVCSKGKVLSVMCKRNRKDRDRFEQQECDWCWDEKQGAKRTPMQKDEVAKHCKTVSHHAANFLLVVCGLLFISILAILAILILRLWSRERARTEFTFPTSGSHMGNRSRNMWSMNPASNLAKPSRRAEPLRQGLPRVPWYQLIFKNPSVSRGTNGQGNRSGAQLQEKNGDPFPPDGTQCIIEKPRIPIMPTAIRSRVSSNVEDSGRRKLPDLGDHNGQGGLRRSLRRSGAVSSGSERIPLTESITTTRRPFMGEPELAAAGKDTATTTRTVALR